MRLYIDPGTGGMLFTILMALIGAFVYLLRGIKVRMRSLFREKGDDEKTEERIPLAIFSDHKRYWNIFEPICDELERRGLETVYMTESADDPALSKHYNHIRCEWIGEGNRAYAKLNFLRAQILFSTTPGLDVYQWKRSRETLYYVHIPHAPGDITRYHMFGLDYYDAVLLSGAYQVEQLRKLEAMRGLPEKELRIVGIPYMDEMRKRLRGSASSYLTSEEERTVLLAPSWGKSGILSVFGSDILDALLKTGYRIIVRPHPQSFTADKETIRDLMDRYPDGKQLEWNRDNDNFDVLRRADILISDFSGVMFDFTLIFDKPIIYADTSFNREPYDCSWLDENLWTFEVLPKLGKQLTRENLLHVKELIDECLNDPASKTARDEARAETWQYPGEGAQRTVDYLAEKLVQLTAEGANERKEGESAGREGKHE